MARTNSNRTRTSDPVLRSRSGSSYNTQTGVRTNADGSTTQVRSASEARAGVGGEQFRSSGSGSSRTRTRINPGDADFASLGSDGKAVFGAQNIITPTNTTQPMTQPLPTQTSPTAADFNLLREQANGSSGMIKDVNGNLTQPIETPAQKTAIQTLIDSQQKAFDEAPTSQSLFEKAQRETGVIQKQNTVNQLTGQINAITASSNAEQLKLQAQGRGQTTGFIGGEQARISREAAIQSLPISALLAAAQGDLNTAQENVTRLFSIFSKDAENRTNFYNRQAESIYADSSKKEQAILDANIKAGDRKYQEYRDLTQNMASFASDALKFGDNSLFKALSEGIPTFGTDTASQKKINDWQNSMNAKLGQSTNPMLALDMAIKRRQLSLMGAPTATEKKEEATRLKSAAGQNAVLKDKLDLIGVIQTSKGISSRVGTSFLSRVPQGEGFFGGIKVGVQSLIKAGVTLGVGSFRDASSSVTGQGQVFSGAVHRLTSTEFLNALINAKQQGATFGALTDREGDALRASASQLNDWEIKDGKGIGTGVWNIDEASFLTEVGRIKALAQQAVGTTLSDEEQTFLNDAFGQSSDPALYFN